MCPVWCQEAMMTSLPTNWWIPELTHEKTLNLFVFSMWYVTCVTSPQDVVVCVYVYICLCTYQHKYYILHEIYVRYIIYEVYMTWIALTRAEYSKRNKQRSAWREPEEGKMLCLSESGRASWNGWCWWWLWTLFNVQKKNHKRKLPEQSTYSVKCYHGIILQICFLAVKKRTRMVPFS